MSRLQASRITAPRALWGLFRRLALSSPGLLAVSTATAVLQSAVLIPIAVLVRHMFDTAIPRRNVSSIVLSGVAILGLYAAAAALGYVARATALRTAASVVTGLRRDLIAKVLALPQRWHERQRLGEVQSVLTQDTERVETMLAAFAGNLVPALVIGAALVVAALVISPVLFLTGVVTVPPLMLAGRLAARRLNLIVREWSMSASRFTSYAQLLLRALVTTRIASGERSALQRGVEQAGEVSELHRQMGQAGATFSAFENAIAAAAGSAVLVVGGIAVSHHSMTLGDLLAFYAVLGLLLRQLHSLGWQTSTVVVGLQSISNIDGLLAVDQTEPYARGRRALQFQGGVSFTEVSFSYAEAPVLSNVTLAIEPGEHVVLIGPNGAGKSTLVNLLLALYAPDSGLLCADGVPYPELDISSLRRQLGVVLQDPVLLPGTIRENIAYGRSEASEEAIRAAAEAATAADFIEDLPDGYATTIGDEGSGLSGGQRQRVAIARALLGTPSLLVLDEPSTYLDDAAVGTLMARVMSLPQSPTVLLVTHDAQLATHAERVIELRDGRVAGDSGTRQRLGAGIAAS